MWVWKAAVRSEDHIILASHSKNVGLCLEGREESLAYVKKEDDIIMFVWLKDHPSFMWWRNNRKRETGTNAGDNSLKQHAGQLK